MSDESQFSDKAAPADRAEHGPFDESEANPVRPYIDLGGLKVLPREGLNLRISLTPATPSAAFGMDEKQDDPVTMYLNDVFTVTANLAGLPGISVPAGLDAQGLPLGLQVVGRAFDEETVFAVGAALERAAAFEALPAVRAGA